MTTLIAAFLASTLAIAVIPAQEHGKPADKPAGTSAKPATVFVVTRSHGSYQVMTKEAWKARNRQIADDYAKAVQLRAKEKAAAKRAHKKVTGSDPKKPPQIEAVGGEYPTREAAETALKALEQEKAKEHESNAKKEPKPGQTRSGSES